MKKYDYVGVFKEGLARVELDKKFGFINENGEEITELKYDYVWNFQEGFAIARFQDKYCFINKDGKEVISPKYDSIRCFKKGLAVMWIDGKFGAINTNGEEIVLPKYEYLEDFKNGFAEGKINDNYCFVSNNGKESFFVKGKEIGPENDILYYIKHQSKLIFKIDCFTGDKETLINAIKDIHGDSDLAQEYLAYIKEIEKELFVQ